MRRPAGHGRCRCAPATWFVSAIEAEDGRRLAEALIKQMTGGDTMTARFLYGEFFEFLPEFKILLAVNHKPLIRNTDHAIWRRIRLVPFTVTIPEAERDKDLPDKLRRELPGILAWAVQGCLDWQREGLGMPEPVNKNETPG
jgi:putative DNA primase/helicase